MEWGDEWGELWGGAINSIEDHDEQAVDRLSAPFRDQTMQDLVKIYANRQQAIDNIISDMPTRFNIEAAAAGDQDVLGEVEGIDRLGFSDDFYQVMLRTQAHIVIPGRRTIEGLLSMVRSLLNDNTRPIDYRESAIKTYILTLFDLTADVQSGYLGWEIDVYANWEITHDLACTARYGVFFPGKAFSDRTTRTFLLVGMTWSF